MLQPRVKSLARLSPREGASPLGWGCDEVGGGGGRAPTEALRSSRGGGRASELYLKVWVERQRQRGGWCVASGE